MFSPCGSVRWGEFVMLSSGGGKKYYWCLLEGLFDSFRYVFVYGLKFFGCKYGFSVGILNLY